MDALRYFVFPGWLYSVVKSIKIVVLIAVSLILLPEAKEVLAQTRVTGHVFAEIVEPTSLMVNSSNAYVQYSENNKLDEIELSNVSLNSGAEVEVGVTIQSGGLVSEKGDDFSFDAFECPECDLAEVNVNNQAKVFRFVGTPGDDIWSAKDRKLNGKYQVTFVYN